MNGSSQALLVPLVKAVAGSVPSREVMRLAVRALLYLESVAVLFSTATVTVLPTIIHEAFPRLGSLSHSSLYLVALAILLFPVMYVSQAFLTATNRYRNLAFANVLGVFGKLHCCVHFDTALASPGCIYMRRDRNRYPSVDNVR